MDGLWSSKSESFTHLVSISGLDPKRDFRGANLRGMNFQGENLSGFNFTDADFTGALLQGVLFGDAVLTGATFDPAGGAAVEESKNRLETILQDIVSASKGPVRISALKRLASLPSLDANLCGTVVSVVGGRDRSGAVVSVAFKLFFAKIGADARKSALLKTALNNPTTSTRQLAFRELISQAKVDQRFVDDCIAVSLSESNRFLRIAAGEMYSDSSLWPRFVDAAKRYVSYQGDSVGAKLALIHLSESSEFRNHLPVVIEDFFDKRPRNLHSWSKEDTAFLSTAISISFMNRISSHLASIEMLRMFRVSSDFSLDFYSRLKLRDIHAAGASRTFITWMLACAKEPDLEMTLEYCFGVSRWERKSLAELIISHRKRASEAYLAFMFDGTTDYADELVAKLSDISDTSDLISKIQQALTQLLS